MPDLTVPRFGWRRQWIPAHLRRRLLAALLASRRLSCSRFQFPAPDEPREYARRPLPGTQAVDPLTAEPAEPIRWPHPIRLVDPQVGGLLQVGASVDVLAAAQSQTGPADDTQSPARVIAHGVRVLAVPRPRQPAAEAPAGPWSCWPSVTARRKRWPVQKPAAGSLLSRWMLVA